MGSLCIDAHTTCANVTTYRTETAWPAWPRVHDPKEDQDMNFNPGDIVTCPYMPADQHAHPEAWEA